jgi:hypothetical protein
MELSAAYGTQATLGFGRDDLLYFSRSVGILSEGAYGCGPLFSQHILCVGAILGVFPRSILGFGEVAHGTKTHARIMEQYPGVFTKSGKDHGNISQRILEAISLRTGSSMMMAENAVCKALQSEGGTHHVDSIYKSLAVFKFDPKENSFLILEYGRSPTSYVPKLSHVLYSHCPFQVRTDFFESAKSRSKKHEPKKRGRHYRSEKGSVEKRSKRTNVARFLSPSLHVTGPMVALTPFHQRHRFHLERIVATYVLRMDHPLHRTRDILFEGSTLVSKQRYYRALLLLPEEYQTLDLSFYKEEISERSVSELSVLAGTEWDATRACKQLSFWSPIENMRRDILLPFSGNGGTVKHVQTEDYRYFS